MQVKIPGIVKVDYISEYEVFNKLKQKHHVQNDIVYKVAISYKVGKRRKLKKVRVISQVFCDCCGLEARFI